MQPTRAPPERLRRAFALLTKTYHRSRVTGLVPYQNCTFPITPLFGTFPR